MKCKFHPKIKMKIKKILLPNPGGKDITAKINVCKECEKDWEPKTLNCATKITKIDLVRTIKGIQK